MGNQDVRALGGGPRTPPIGYDENGVPYIDSADEGEANGRYYEQSQAVRGSVHYAEAQARGTSKPLFAPVSFNHDDLLSGQPDQDGDNPTPSDSDD